MARKAARAHNVAQIRPEPPQRARAELEFDEPAVLGALFGQFDANLVQLENRLGVFISARGNRIQIEGRSDDVARARDVLRWCRYRHTEDLVVVLDEPLALWSHLLTLDLHHRWA